MKMKTREEMGALLTKLQSLQAKAMRLGLHNCAIYALVFQFEDEGDGEEGLLREYGDTQEIVLEIVLFKRGDNSDDDYKSVYFYQSDSHEKDEYSLKEVEDFITL